MKEHEGSAENGGYWSETATTNRPLFAPNKTEKEGERWFTRKRKARK